MRRIQILNGVSGISLWILFFFVYKGIILSLLKMNMQQIHAYTAYPALISYEMLGRNF